MAPDRVEHPVSIPAEELEAAFTVSSMRVCVKFARSQLAELEVMGQAFVPSSQRLFVSFFEGQVSEADAHGLGRCVWVAQMSAALERLEADVREGVSLSRWGDQLRAFSEGTDRALLLAGWEGKNLPLSELGDRREQQH